MAKHGDIFNIGATILFAALTSSVLHAQQEQGTNAEQTEYSAGLLARVRLAATSIPGDLPESVAFAKVAESHRPYSAIIQGGSDEQFVSARTAFQIRFPQGSVMLDSGMDLEVHTYYGFGRTEPYWQEVNDQVQQALLQANKILITHEHGDHISGVLRSSHSDELAAKTILTIDQIETLSQRPQLPQIQISAEQIAQFIVVDYQELLPVAPGMVLIKAPGHTPGHQMLYTLLENGQELIFIGDIGWSLENIRQLKLRPQLTLTRIGEDPQALMAQMIWIKERMDQDGLIVVPSHDNRLLLQYVEEGLMSDTLRL